MFPKGHPSGSDAVARHPGRCRLGEGAASVATGAPGYPRNASPATIAGMGSITLYAIFPGDEAGYHVRAQLADRDYETELARLRTGELVVIVTTRPYLRAEVEGLVWLGGGRIGRVAAAGMRRDQSLIG